MIDALLKMAGKEQGLNLMYSTKDLAWQIVFGSNRYLCPQLWYLFDMIVFTLLMWSIFRLFRKNAWEITTVLCVVVLFLQYSGRNYNFFSQFNYVVRDSMGRLAEVFPFVCIGLIFAYKDVAEKLKKNRYFTLFISMLVLLVVFRYDLGSAPAVGFAYQGTNLLAYAIIIFLTFFEFPFEMMPDFIKGTLRFLSRYSFGVFFIHFGVGYCFNEILCPRYGWKVNSFIESIGIYIVSLFVSFAISRIPIKYARQLVE